MAKLRQLILAGGQEDGIDGLVGWLLEGAINCGVS